MNFLRKIQNGLAKTHDRIVEGMARAFGRGSLDDAAWDELEMLLITADTGTAATADIIAALRKKRIDTVDELKEGMRETVQTMLAPFEAALETRPPSPFCIMVVGVNGVGKTTTIAKLAGRFRSQGKSVVLAAADTFRAAAAEQLAVWAERAGVELVRQREGADPAAVAYDGLKAALARSADILIIDTAGRLHTKANLMEELKKIQRVLKKESPEYPQETLLVLDATVGQNALNQARIFGAAVGVTGIVMTKLDGTAKGGILVQIVRELKIPVKFVGVGEKMDDLEPFDAAAFAGGLFS